MPHIPHSSNLSFCAEFCNYSSDTEDGWTVEEEENNYDTGGVHRQDFDHVKRGLASSWV